MLKDPNAVLKLMEEERQGKLADAARVLPENPDDEQKLLYYKLMLKKKSMGKMLADALRQSGDIDMSQYRLSKGRIKQ